MRAAALGPAAELLWGYETLYWVGETQGGGGGAPSLQNGDPTPQDGCELRLAKDPTICSCECRN
eukprot:6283155-Pyramimonas_sp.AAC.1